jgi:hypothetical protein
LGIDESQFVRVKKSMTRRIRDIALAVHSYEARFGQSPPAYKPDANGRPKHSWRVLVLPNPDRPSDRSTNVGPTRQLQTAASAPSCGQSHLGFEIVGFTIVDGETVSLVELGAVPGGRGSRTAASTTALTGFPCLLNAFNVRK